MSTGWSYLSNVSQFHSVTPASSNQLDMRRILVVLTAALLSNQADAIVCYVQNVDGYNDGLYYCKEHVTRCLMAEIDGKIVRYLFSVSAWYPHLNSGSVKLCTSHVHLWYGTGLTRGAALNRRISWFRSCLAENASCGQNFACCSFDHCNNAPTPGSLQASSTLPSRASRSDIPEFSSLPASERACGTVPS